MVKSCGHRLIRTPNNLCWRLFRAYRRPLLLSRENEVIVFDARTSHAVGLPIRLSDRLPTKVWFSPHREGQTDTYLLIVNQLQEGAHSEVSVWDFRSESARERSIGP